MELKLQRADLLQVDAISSTSTLRLLPPGKKQKQKLLVGDDSGIIYCYEFKKGEPLVVFTYKAFDGPVSSLTIGGISSKRDKIFASSHQKIVGINKKGKEFFNFTSTLTESIHSIVVQDTKIWNSSEYVHNLYNDGEDVNYFMSCDKINDTVIENITRDYECDVVLACQDRCIRVISGSQCSIEIPVSSPVSSVTTVTAIRSNGINGYEGDGTLDIGASAIGYDATGILYGTEMGEIGHVQVNREGSLSKSWCIEDNARSLESSKVNAIILADLTKNGVVELIIGRDDGRVEVFGSKGSSDITSPLVKMFSKSLGESVRSLQCGSINSSEHNEIIAAGYSGKIVSFTTELITQRAPDDGYGRSQHTVNDENRIKFLKSELKQLQSKVYKEKDKLKTMYSGNGGGRTLLDKACNFGAQNFPLHTSFILDSENAVYKLKIEIQSPLDMVIIRSPAVLELKESSHTMIIPSIVPFEYNNPDLTFKAASEINCFRAKFVAMYLCRNNEKNLDIHFRPCEGHNLGDIIVIVIARCNPKTAKVEKFKLKPLSLHTKIHEPISSKLLSQGSSIRFTGSTSINQSLEWVSKLFPEVPQRLEDNEDEVTLRFMNSFTKAVTICIIHKDEIIVESDSISTLSIAKETLSGIANQRRLRFHEQVIIRDDTVPLFLNKLWPQLNYQLSLATKMELIDSLKEISTPGDEFICDFLSPEYQLILTNRERIHAEYTERENAIDYLCTIIVDLYMDWQKFMGLDSRYELNEIKKVIYMNDIKGLYALFQKDQQT